MRATYASERSAAQSSTAASEAGPDTELSFDEISDALLEPLSAQRVTSEYAKELLETVADESLVDAEAFAAFEEVARDHPTYAKLRGLKQWRDFYRAQSK